MTEPTYQQIAPNDDLPCSSCTRVVTGPFQATGRTHGQGSMRGQCSKCGAITYYDIQREYRIEQLSGEQWEKVAGLDSDIQHYAIDNCYKAFKATPDRPTRVVEQATGLIPYYLNERGNRAYSKEKH